ncbi:Down syndrome cell adhesion molecule-like protein 1 homolog [Dermacentor silvarum]|uniref:Down syndrome cell adhesion molecule-like protein 1 homolog n=1 Tax=Dermacentor silvarum TaxID=543639 RepID=UPI0021013BF1|nr:Down syndrome cell adhesion molecule-like protein 1 homolog [Dermacentor silvarum]
METLLLSILTCSLVLVPALKIVELRVPSKVAAGTTVTLDCLFDLEGDALYTVKWFKNAEEFYHFMPISVPPRKLFPVAGISASLTEESNSSVTLDNVNSSASALYKCEVYSDAPSFLMVGDYRGLLVVEPPDSPRRLQVVETTSRSVTLEWTAPNASNEVITSYKIQHKEHESANWNFASVNLTVPGNETTAVVSDLKPYTTYDFRVFAESALGRSNASDPVNATTSEEAPGGPPTNVSAQALGLQSVKVTWKPPSKDLHFGAIRGYYVGYRPAAASPAPFQYVTIHASDQKNEERLLTSLSPSTRYGIVVQAFNGQGAGPRSAEVVVETHGFVPPTPTQLSVVSTSATSVTLEWKRPAGDLNPVEGYHVLHTVEASGDEWTETHVRGNRHSLTIGQLKCGSTYRFAVRAYNDAGTGNVSDAIIVNTKGAPPTAPPDAILAVLPYMRQALVLTRTWHNGGCPIERFTARYRHQRDKVWTMLEAEQSQSEPRLELRGLSPANSYKVVVTASNNAGTTEAEYEFTTLTDSSEKHLKLHVPPFALPGATVRLDCFQDFGNIAAQTVRWFKDGQEFYQFVPTEVPSLKTFDVEGVNVNTLQSTARPVYIEKLNASSAGTYSCEVSSETSLIRTVAGKELVIAERLPAMPRIVTDRDAYHIGDTVKLSCVGVRSKPSPALSVFVNDQLVNDTNTRLEVHPDGLPTVSIETAFTLGQEDVKGGHVRVRCEALFSDAFAATVEDNIRVEPRWMLSGTSSPKDPCIEKASTIFKRAWVYFSEAHDDSIGNGNLTFSTVQ